MSLLLEALRKAEQAKLAAQGQAPAADMSPPAGEQPPDIGDATQMRSEDLRLVETTPAAAKDNAEFASAAAQAAPYAEREQAQRAFAAGAWAPSPRKPFYLTLGALGLFALGAVGYFWIELHPRKPVIAPPASASAAAPVASAPPVIAAEAVRPPGAAIETQPPAPGPATTNATEAAAPTPAPKRRGNRARPPTAQTAASTATAELPAVAAPAPDSAAAATISVTPSRVQVDPLLEAGYRAFNARDFAGARAAYAQVLGADPNSRDALLGLAAVAMQARQYAEAERLYVRLLELNPLDAYAHAGLIGLKGQVDPVATESRLKSMIAAQPQASFLNFTLGNQYAAQGRWAEAEQAYFRAYRADPQQPDFAYNLAVSLDKLHQPSPALHYYQLALKLAQARPASFDQAEVGKRASQLAH